MQRWPEMRDGDSERAGSRGEHEGARREMANSMVVLSFAGEAPVAGEARTGMVRAAVNSGDEALVEDLGNAKGKKCQGDAPRHREAAEPERGDGNLLELPESTIYGGG